MAKKKNKRKNKRKKNGNGNGVKYIPFGLYRTAVVKATPEERKELYKIKEKHRKGMIRKKAKRRLGVTKPRYEKVLRKAAFKVKKGRPDKFRRALERLGGRR